ncbi:aminotransferase class I/II-fold pyridoxal phosphate-dependent enzyme [uncultured Microscilla sp.]|uniref:pyridoxal phosphate-dependent aminotransferase n=1 Tax=uncultured Microscilla sp. TaxID=432653 RepID=UPI00260C0FC9|nr:aminotransferase class I/II-fold pyridoxal phosphate-dependent enzyme [uncultured Microscilla sp.]
MSIQNVSLNLNVRGLGKSATLAINERVAELQKAGREIYSFGLGQSPFPVPHCVVNALQKHAHEKDYLPVQGLPQLREAVAEFHRREDHVNIQQENVMIGPGSKELMFLLQLAFYGDILIPAPCWVSYIPQAKIIGRKVTMIETAYKNRWTLSPQALEAQCMEENDVDKPRLLILNYPSNPYGDGNTVEELMQIAEVARKYNIIILSDEIYGQTNHQGKHISIARYYPEGTIISSGLSKWCGAGGWRLGTFSFPASLRWLLDALVVVASETYTSVSAPIQYASVVAFRGGDEINEYLLHSRRILNALGKWIVQQLQDAKVRIHPVEGAFYIFPDFEHYRQALLKINIKSSTELCERILEDTGVAALPGSSFGRSKHELNLRMAYVNFDGEKALLASKKVPLDQPLDAEFLAQHCALVVTGISRLIDWLKQL